MRIVVITLTRNEQEIIPHFISHYQEFADHIVVYDSFSTDKTRRIVQEMSRRCCTTEVRDGYTPPLDDLAGIAIKNNAYKSMTADWFIIVDCDEFVYHRDLRDLLERYDRQGITLPRVQGYDMVGDAIPRNGERITDCIRLGVPNSKYESKFAVVKPCVDICYDPGAHTARPTGRVRMNATAEILLLHYKWLSREFVQHKADTVRFSESNHKNKYGYTQGRPAYELWVSRYDELRSKRKRVL